MGDGDLDEMVNICVLNNLSHVYMLRHFEPREVAFQKDLALRLAASGKQLVLLETYTCVPLEKMLKVTGEPYLKFTPFYKHWLGKLNPLQASYEKINWLEQPIEFTPLYDTARAYIEEDLLQLSKFLTRNYLEYDQKRDYPYLKGTSCASALVNHGCVSVHDIVAHLQTLEPSPSKDAYIRQLAWRDFYITLAYKMPEILTNDMNKRYSVSWQNNAMDFQLWCAGQTGYPFVDAAMLHLFQSGRMHNRLRMVVASFLTKHLLIDWREGADWFKEHLMDYDLALNVGGWQWAASTGADAVPYFRVFNPTLQSEKYDPKGDFIRSHIEMLESASSLAIHEPLKHNVPYLEPCIEHKFARQRVLALYEKKKN